MGNEYVSHYDVIVAGAGVAGVRSAIELDKAGYKVALVDHMFSKPQEKSLFLDLDKFPPSLSSQLTVHSLKRHALVNADRPEDSWGKDGEFSTGATEYRPLIRKIAADLPSSVDVIEQTVRSSSDDGKRVSVVIGLRESDSTITADRLVDCSGDRSPVSRKHVTPCGTGLIKDDPLVAWMLGFRARGSFDMDTIYDPIGKEIGGTSWVMAISKEKGDVIASGISRLSEVKLGSQRKTLDNLVKFCREKGICIVDEVEYPMGGIIRSEPVLAAEVAQSRLVWQVGQAAGMADPLMAEAFSPAYLLPAKMAEYMSADKTPLDFYNYWRYSPEGKMFDYEMMLAMLRRRDRHARSGEVGSSASIYKLLTKNMSTAAAELALKERKIPPKEYLVILKGLLEDANLRMTILELSGIYAMTIARDNILPRLVRSI